jgi:hypothetical protein
MKTAAAIKTSLFVFAFVMRAAVAPIALAEPPEQSGIIVHAEYPGYCAPVFPPWCTPPRPYYGTFSIFTISGHFMASGTTADDISATFTAELPPGRYVIVPDDPTFADDAETVTVRAKQFTEVTVWIGVNSSAADPPDRN